VLSLTSTQTGHEFQARDGRVVVGGANFCDIRVSNCPAYAVLLFVRYSDSWVAHNIDTDIHTDIVKKNGHTAPLSSEVRSGDKWQIGDDTLSVKVVDVLPPEETGPELQSECWVRIIGPTAEKKELPFLKPLTLIGSAASCDVTFSEPRLEPRHFLIISTGGTWFLHSLTSGGGSDGLQGLNRLTNGLTFSIGRTQLEFRIQASRKPGGSGTNIPVQTAVGPHNALATDYTASRNRSLPTAAADYPSADADVLIAAQEVLNKVKALLLMSHFRENRLRENLKQALSWMSIRAVEELFRRNAQVRAFRSIGSLLEKYPRDRTLLLTFARMCDIAGLDDICFHTLRLMAKLNPADTEVLRGLARISRHMAIREPTYYAKAIRYWQDVQKLSPQEYSAINSTIKAIMADHTNMRLQVGRKVKFDQ
jgi:hypothetical protein